MTLCPILSEADDLRVPRLFLMEPAVDVAVRVETSAPQLKTVLDLFDADTGIEADPTAGEIDCRVSNLNADDGRCELKLTRLPDRPLDLDDLDIEVEVDTVAGIGSQSALRCRGEDDGLDVEAVLQCRL